MKPDNPTQRGDNQGEGDRRSARRYNNKVREFVKRGQVEPAARDASGYVEQEPGDAARAERTARHGPKVVRAPGLWRALDELIGKARKYGDVVRPIVARAIGVVRARLVRR